MLAILAFTFALMVSCSDLGRDNPLDPKNDKHIVKGAEGEFTDSRDDKVYKWIEIGAQIWMAENLNFEAEGSRCYNDADESCNVYGRMYNWATAMGIDASCNTKTIADCQAYVKPNKHRGICPEGWHIPTYDEFVTLTDYIGGINTAGTKLKATSGWNDYNGASGNGTDDYGFSALPGGYIKPIDGSFQELGSFGAYWSATTDKDDAGNSYRLYLRNDYIYAVNHARERTNFYSLRCVKD